MTQDKSIIIRVDEETKRLFEEAARQSYQTLTSFLIGAGKKAAEEVMEQKQAQEEPAPKIRGPLPTYFRALCAEASRGGAGGYDRPAYELSRHLRSEAPWELEGDAWDEQMDALEGHFRNILRRRAATWGGEPAAEDIEAIWKWFSRNLPRCMALVPARRKGQFVGGVVRAFDDGIMDFPFRPIQKDQG